MTTATATDALVRAVKSGNAKRIEKAQARLDAEADKAARADARKRRLAIAQDQVNRDRREQEARDRVATADAAEASLRELGEPMCIVMYGGHEYIFNLSKTEQVEAGTSIEGVRRLLQAVRNGWAHQVLASRQAGTPVPAEPLTALMSSESGLYHVNRLGLMAARPTATAAPVTEPVVEEVIEK